VTHFEVLGSIISLEWVKLGNLNLICGLILTSTDACVIDYPQRGYVQCHATSLFFWKINNILEMVQDRDMVNGRLTGEIVCGLSTAPISMTLSDLQGQ